jgi:dTDP-4-dehydrorhamnose 3,5-epimerase
VPVGFVHGFLTLSEQAEVHDKTSGFWSKSCERMLRCDDPEPMLAEKDASAPLLA